MKRRPILHETDDRRQATNQANSPSGRTDRLGTPVLEADLPGEVADGLGRLPRTGSVSTLEDWVDAVHRYTDGSIAVEDLCHTNTETPHLGVIDSETYHFQCVYDAIVLAAVVGKPVEVQTRSPDGEPIRATAVGTADLAVDPPTSVFSFGVDTALEPPGEEGPSHEDVYAAVCPWMQAFPDAEAYLDWSARVSAATVAMPFTEVTTVAAALVE